MTRRSGFALLALALSLAGCSCYPPRVIAPPPSDGGPIDVEIIHVCTIEPEVCDGLDQDCDERVDEGDSACRSNHADGVCVAAVCEDFVCDEGWADCDEDTSNGCEARLLSSSNCGACGVVCTDGDVCGRDGCAPLVGDVAVGGDVVVAVGPDGVLVELGPRLVPLRFEVPGEDFVQVGAGSQHRCARTLDGNIYCWGNTDSGQLGLGSDFDFRAEPTPVPLPEPAVDLALSNGAACVVGESGRPYCWGTNWARHIVEGSPSVVSTPTAVSPYTDVQAIAVSDSHICALRAGGVLACWGHGGGYQVDGATNPSWLRVDDVLTSVTGVTVTDGLSCAIVEGTGVHCWGDQAVSGGDVWTSQSILPWPGTAGASAIAISAYRGLIARDGHLWTSRRTAREPLIGPQGELFEVAATIGEPVAFSARYADTCVLDHVGLVWCGDLEGAPTPALDLSGR